MAKLSYPAWMPLPLQSGFSMQPEDRRITSSTVGTSFQKGFGGDVCVADVTLTLNRLQAAWLEQFERDVMVQGSAWFDFPIWHGGEVHWEKCRFKTRPKLASVGGSLHSSFSFSLYVWKRTDMLPECMVKLLACWHPCFFGELGDAIDLLVAEFSLFFEHVSSITRASVNDALSEILEG